MLGIIAKELLYIRYHADLLTYQMTGHHAKKLIHGAVADITNISAHAKCWTRKLTSEKLENKFEHGMSKATAPRNWFSRMNSEWGYQPFGAESFR